MSGLLESRLKAIDKETNYTEKPPFPKRILVSPTSACNLRCKFCSCYDYNRKNVLLDLNFAEKLFNDVYNYGVKEIGLYMRGDSFLNPYLDEIVKLANDVGFEYIYITTNGVLATSDKVSKLVQNGLNSIKFSINAVARKQYEIVHGVDAYNIVMKNLLDVSRLRGQGKGLKLYVSSVYDGDVTSEMNAFKDSLLESVDDFVFYRQFHMNSDIKKCNMPFNSAYVTSDGLLLGCCRDFGNNLVIADLKQTKFSDAWNCKVFQVFRKMLLQKNIDKILCGKCIKGLKTEIVKLSAIAR